MTTKRPGEIAFDLCRYLCVGRFLQHFHESSRKELLADDPAFATTAREFYGKFLPAQLVERLIDGLRKAGLDVPGSQR